MELLLQIANELKEIRNELPNMIAEVLFEHTDEIEMLNVGQLDRGERVDGSTLPDYSRVSVTKYGKPPGPMRMEDTGNFKRGIALRVSQTAFELVGTDSKTAMLENSYGPLVGTSEESNDIIANEILIPGLQDKIRDRLTIK